MTNIQLSSNTDQWYTPAYLVEMVRSVLCNIDLDPASSIEANKTVEANRILTKEDDALASVWSDIPVAIYLNPPGGKLGNKSMTSLFWQKLIDLRSQGLLKEAIFMGFSLEHLAVTQSCSESICDFPFCIPRKRIRFVSPNGDFSSPTHSNVICYIPGKSNNMRRFNLVFSEIGKVVNPSF